MEFVKQLREKDKVMVVSFDEQVHILSEPTNDREVLKTRDLQHKSRFRHKSL